MIFLIAYDEKIKNKYIRILCINNRKIKEINIIVLGVAVLLSMMIVMLFLDNYKYYLVDKIIYVLDVLKKDELIVIEKDAV